MRTVTSVGLLVTIALLGVLAIGLAQGSNSPGMMEVSSREQNVTAGDSFDVELVMTSSSGFYADEKVGSVNVTLNYSEGVTAEEVRYGDWFDGDGESTNRTHELRPETREVQLEQASKSGDSGQWKRFATVEFSADRGFEGDVDLRVSELRVTFTNGQPAHVVTFDEVVHVKPAESGGLPLSGFVASVCFVSVLLVALARLRR